MKRVDICFSPALYDALKNDNKDSIIVVVDIFRATTTICTAFINGVSQIIPVATTEEAQVYKQKGYLVGAERNVKQCDFADFGNSPFQYTPDKVKDKEIVLTTTNCTHAIDIVQGASEVIIGSFLNLTAIASFCIEKQKNVLIMCAGWNDRFNMEDTLFGGALINRLKIEDYRVSSDASQVALSMWQVAQSDIKGYLSQSEHIERLVNNKLQDSVAYCLTPDITNLVPIYNKSTKSIFI